MKQQINFRASELTGRQLAQLTQQTGMNQTEVIAVAIDRMFREEIKMKTLGDYRVIRRMEPSINAIYIEQLIASNSGTEWVVVDAIRPTDEQIAGKQAKDNSDDEIIRTYRCAKWNHDHHLFSS